MQPGMFATVEEALEELRAGRFLVVVDEERRENEGDLVLAAEKATDAALGFMIRYTGGVICVSTTAERLRQLRLPQMVSENQDPKRTAFTVTTDYRHGTTTGISGPDRCKTIRAFTDPSVVAEDFQRPGHVFPLEARAGGVLERNGHTEATVDLCRLAGLYPAGALSEIIHDDGTMMRRPDLHTFCQTHGLRMVTIASITEYRRAHEAPIQA